MPCSLPAWFAAARTASQLDRASQSARAKAGPNLHELGYVLPEPGCLVSAERHEANAARISAVVNLLPVLWHHLNANGAALSIPEWQSILGLAVFTPTSPKGLKVRQNTENALGRSLRLVGEKNVCYDLL